MAQHYRAVRRSYGFRGRHWKEDMIVYDVKESENIPEHFVPIGTGEVVPPPEEVDRKDTLTGNLPKVAPDGEVPETLTEAADPDWRKKHPKQAKPKAKAKK